jgi:hypothetical protein
LQQAAHGTGVIEELLNLCWDGSGLRCHVGPRTSERMLPLLREDGVAIPIFICTGPVYFFAIVCHPFFVFGQREVALFELPKFAAGKLAAFSSSVYSAAFARYCFAVNMR